MNDLSHLIDVSDQERFKTKHMLINDQMFLNIILSSIIKEIS